MSLMHDAIDEGIGDYWKEETKETYHQLADRLVAKGFSEEEAVGILLAAFGAAASEYGD